MTVQFSKFGIYLNLKENKVVRINSPYWIPQGEEWVLITAEVNTPLVKVRELVKAKGLVGRAEDVTWGTIPQVSEASPAEGV